MNLSGFFLAMLRDWISLMSGIAAIVLTAIGLARKWKALPPQAFRVAALVCFFVAAARVWTTQNDKLHGYVENAEAPYLILQYSPTVKGPSGIMITNVGEQTALNVKVNDIRMGSTELKFGQVLYISVGAAVTTYPNGEQGNGGLSPGDLRQFLSQLPENADGHSGFTVSADYSANDGVRRFRTTCTFEYDRRRGQIDSPQQEDRELLTKP